eukprot:6197536-Pleurochrysis_carterae.AAC.2
MAETVLVCGGEPAQLEIHASERGDGSVTLQFCAVRARQEDAMSTKVRSRQSFVSSLDGGSNASSCPFASVEQGVR